MKNKNLLTNDSKIKITIIYNTKNDRKLITGPSKELNQEIM